MERQYLITAQVLACLLLSATLGVAGAFMISVPMTAAGEPYRDMWDFLDSVFSVILLMSAIFGALVMLPFGLALCVMYLFAPNSSETSPPSPVTNGLLWFTMWLGMPSILVGANFACWLIWPATTHPNFQWTQQTPGVPEVTSAWLIMHGVAAVVGLVAFIFAIAIRSWVRRINRDAALCPSCSYPREGLAGSVCPECGSAFA
ncbi:MAG: hypothetical protein Phyf2KO_12840 [Phycisphaerales bacterium]